MAPTDDIKFVPPQPKPSLIGLAQSLADLYAAWFCRFTLKLDNRDRQRLHNLDQSRVLYVANHPTHADGVTLFVLSAHLRQQFHYVAAYESFKGWQGRFMAWLGVYSIRRGVGDRSSIAATLKLMEQPDCKLVMFPEGGCSYQNDTVMPFREGAIGLSLRALKKLAQKSDLPPNFYLVPVSLKYQHRQAMDKVIAQSLTKLEKALNVTQKSPDFYWRLRSVARALLQNLEAEFQVEAPPRQDQGTGENWTYWNQRIDRLKNTMLLDYEQHVGIKPRPHLPMRERIYTVQAELEKRHAKLVSQAENATQSAASGPQEAAYEKLYEDTLRLLNFDAIYDGYIAKNPTQERFLDTLTTLEREVFRVEAPLAKAMRTAQVKIGEIINLKDYLAPYQQDKDATVQQLTQQIQHAVQANVLAMSREQHPKPLTQW